MNCLYLVIHKTFYFNTIVKQLLLFTMNIIGIVIALFFAGYYLLSGRFVRSKIANKVTSKILHLADPASLLYPRRG